MLNIDIMDDETYYKELMLKKDIKYRELEDIVEQKAFMMIKQRQTQALLKKGCHPNTVLQQEYNIMVKLEKDVQIDKEYTVLTDYMYLSVCPPEGTPLEVLHKAIEKYLKKVKILEYLYVIEQRGEVDEEIGQGLHAHILIYHTYTSYSSLKRDYYNTFKNIIDIHHKLTYKWLNIKHNNTDQDVRNRIEYMTGVKKDEVKQKKQIYDKIYREKFNLKQSYGNLQIQPPP